MDEQDDGAEAIRLAFRNSPDVTCGYQAVYHNNSRAQRQGSCRAGRQFCSTRRTTSRHYFPVSDKPDEFTSD